VARRYPAQLATGCDGAIDALRRAIDLTGSDTPELAARLTALADAHLQRINTGRERDDDLDRLLAIQEQLTHHPDTATNPTTWAIYGHWLRRRWQRDPANHSDDLDQAIHALHRAVDLTTPDHPVRTDHLAALANAYIDRLDTTREQPGDLDQLLTIQEQLTHHPDTATNPTTWAIYGHGLRRRWQRDPANHSDDLDQAIHALHRAVDLTAPDDPNQTRHMIALANAYADRTGTDREGDEDLDNLVKLRRDVAHRSDAADRARAWAALGEALNLRWQRHRWSFDLDDHIQALDQAYRLSNPDDDQYTSRLMRLVSALAERLESDTGFPARSLEQVDDLDRLIALLNEAVTRPDVEDLSALEAFRAECHLRRWHRAGGGYQTPEENADLVAALNAARAALAASQPDEEQDRCVLAANMTLLAYINNVGDVLLQEAISLAKRAQKPGNPPAAELAPPLRRAVRSGIQG